MLVERTLIRRELGCVFYGNGLPEDQAHALLTHAADRGVTFWDTSNRYGKSEKVLGKWFAKTWRRSDILLATKTSGYIHEQAAQSLKNPQTDYIDLYYQHRVESALRSKTLRPYVEAGTVRWIGLSECSADHLRRARAIPGPFEPENENSGVLDAARELGVGVVAYSPLGSGEYKSRDDFGPGDMRYYIPRFSDEQIPKTLALAAKFLAVADRYGATPGQAALAWILAEHPDFTVEFDSIPLSEWKGE
ncbi:hypothetical protein FOMPIDRAFT_1027125 [Fomitopsis schrenkii]|uniref:NADP-dependent oxidoreductase domain-containing protein n=1 Tax=Fomitopsis schrenkii TaxID=2126942 RepID=S8EK30_FOMSC|nr:hypothetical protein FOMPIDRAFT_1027125 [Fomitopsis schrenkii]